MLVGLVAGSFLAVVELIEIIVRFYLKERVFSSIQAENPPNLFLNEIDSIMSYPSI